MNRRATRADVAKAAGVSKTTVTYVMTERYEVSIPQETRARVRSVAERLGYRPHAAAQALASGRTGMVNVVFPIRIGSHYADVLRYFEQHSTTHAYRMVASTIGHSGMQNVGSDLDLLLNGLTDGVILVDTPAPFIPEINKVLPRYSDKAVISCGVFVMPETDSVKIDLAPGVEAAILHLLERKPKRLAFFGPNLHDEDDVLETFVEQGRLDPRIYGYFDMSRKHEFEPEVIDGNPSSRKVSCESLAAHVKTKGCPDALFCFNDSMAIAANKTLRDMGFAVGRDVAIVGCDGTEDGEYMDPPLSTIVQPIARVCDLAWELMVGRLGNSKQALRSVAIDAEFVARQSSLKV